MLFLENVLGKVEEAPAPRKKTTVFLQEGISAESLSHLQDITFLSEAYFERSPQLIRCEKLLDQVVSQCKATKTFAGSSKFFDQIEEVESILAKLFNFKRFMLHVGVDGIAYTFPPFELQDDDSDAMEIEKGPNSYRYKKPYVDCVVNVDNTLFSLADNGAQILGVILHEIGHNFYKQDRAFFLWRWLLKVFYMFHYNGFVKKYQNARKDRPDLEKSDGIIAKIYRWWIGLLTADNNRRAEQVCEGKFNAFVQAIYNPIGLLGTIVAKVSGAITAGFNLLLGNFNIDGYANEKFADDFATLHGYGAEAQQLLMKFHVPTDKDAYASIQRAGEYFCTLVMFDVHLLDVHPQMYTRIVGAEERLLKEKANEKNPRILKAIDEDLAKVRAAKAKFEKYKSEKKVLDISFMDKLKDSRVKGDRVEEIDNAFDVSSKDSSDAAPVTA